MGSKKGPSTTAFLDEWLQELSFHLNFDIVKKTIYKIKSLTAIPLLSTTDTSSQAEDKGKKVFPKQAMLLGRISVGIFGEPAHPKWLGTSLLSTIWWGDSENLLKGSQIERVYPRSI